MITRPRPVLPGVIVARNGFIVVPLRLFLNSSANVATCIVETLQFVILSPEILVIIPNYHLTKVLRTTSWTTGWTIGWTKVWFKVSISFDANTLDSCFLNRQVFLVIVRVLLN